MKRRHDQRQHDHYAALVGSSNEAEYKEVLHTTLGGGGLFQLVQLWGTRELDEDEEKGCHLIPVGGEVCSSIYAEDTPDQMTQKGTSKNP